MYVYYVQNSKKMPGFYTQFEAKMTKNACSSNKEIVIVTTQAPNDLNNCHASSNIHLSVSLLTSTTYKKVD